MRKDSEEHATEYLLWRYWLFRALYIFTEYCVF